MEVDRVERRKKNQYHKSITPYKSRKEKKRIETTNGGFLSTLKDTLYNWFTFRPPMEDGDSSPYTSESEEEAPLSLNKHKNSSLQQNLNLSVSKSLQQNPNSSFNQSVNMRSSREDSSSYEPSVLSSETEELRKNISNLKCISDNEYDFFAQLLQEKRVQNQGDGPLEPPLLEQTSLLNKPGGYLNTSTNGNYFSSSSTRIPPGQLSAPLVLQPHLGKLATSAPNNTEVLRPIPKFAPQYTSHDIVRSFISRSGSRPRFTSVSNNSSTLVLPPSPSPSSSQSIESRKRGRSSPTYLPPLPSKEENEIVLDSQPPLKQRKIDLTSEKVKKFDDLIKSMLPREKSSSALQIQPQKAKSKKTTSTPNISIKSKSDSRPLDIPPIKKTQANNMVEEIDHDDEPKLNQPTKRKSREQDPENKKLAKKRAQRVDDTIMNDDSNLKHLSDIPLPPISNFFIHTKSELDEKDLKKKNGETSTSKASNLQNGLSLSLKPPETTPTSFGNGQFRLMDDKTPASSLSQPTIEDKKPAITGFGFLFQSITEAKESTTTEDKQSVMTPSQTTIEEKKPTITGFGLSQPTIEDKKLTTEFGLSQPITEDKKPATTAFVFPPQPTIEDKKPATTAFVFPPQPTIEDKKPATTAFVFSSQPIIEDKKPATTGFVFSSQPIIEDKKPATEFGLSQPTIEDKKSTTEFDLSQPITEDKKPATTGFVFPSQPTTEDKENLTQSSFPSQPTTSFIFSFQPTTEDKKTTITSFKFGSESTTQDKKPTSPGFNFLSQSTTEVKKLTTVDNTLGKSETNKKEDKPKTESTPHSSTNTNIWKCPSCQRENSVSEKYCLYCCPENLASKPLPQTNVDITASLSSVTKPESQIKLNQPENKPTTLSPFVTHEPSSFPKPSLNSFSNSSISKPVDNQTMDSSMETSSTSATPSGSVFGSTTSSFPSTFGSFGTSTLANPSSNAPFGSTSSAFGSSSTFGSSSSTFGSSSSNTFGSSSTNTFGSTPTPTFGSISSNTFGFSLTNTFGSTPTPTFGPSSSNTFGSSSTNTFGSTPASTFGSTPASTFGSSSTFGPNSTNNSFGQIPFESPSAFNFIGPSSSAPSFSNNGGDFTFGGGSATSEPIQPSFNVGRKKPQKKGKK